MADELLTQQRQVTKVALQVLKDSGFALAGSGAIREHGLTDRPTQDVDLFTARSTGEDFARSFDLMVAALEDCGYQVNELRRQHGFAQLNVCSPNGTVVHMDLGIDWRSEAPVVLDIGPVLALNDAVGNKVAALFSRGEVRDFLDVDAIRQSGRYTDAELIKLAEQSDAGFSVEYFVHRLKSVRLLHPDHVADYRVTAEQLEAVKARILQWAIELQTEKRDR